MGEPRKMMSEDKVKQEIERCKKEEKKMVTGQLPFLLCAARIQVLQDVLLGTWFFERSTHSDT